MVTDTKSYTPRQATPNGHVIEWSRPSETLKYAIPWMERAMHENVHVLLCTVETLGVAIVAGIRAWEKHDYHLCVRLDRGSVKKHGARKRYEHPHCHGLRTKAIKVEV
jgi:hypothetical protein